jgi:signal transduction histidine kinase
MSGLPHVGAVAPAAMCTLLLLAAQAMRGGRRRAALNEAVHELRRPLQAIALADAGRGPEGAGSIASSLCLLASALERLDGTINGRPRTPMRQRVAIGPLIDAAARRGQLRAALVGGSVRAAARLDGVTIAGDGSGLSQALDNLIVNAIEHGGPSIAIEGRSEPERLLLTVTDSGRRAPVAPGSMSAGAIARLTGRRRHGHGLRVVRKVAAAHDGRFELCHHASGSVATLELPLPGERRAAA